MYGKCFSKMYEGSMMGKGPEVFALWPYIISNADRTGHLELNPKLIGVKIGMKPERVSEIIAVFLRPEPDSRSKELGGRKLERLGEYLYRVVNYETYRNIRNDDDRKEANRIAAEKYRRKKTALKSEPLAGETAAVKAYENGQLDKDFEPVKAQERQVVEMREYNTSPLTGPESAGASVGAIPEIEPMATENIGKSDLVTDAGTMVPSEPSIRMARPFEP